MKMMFNVLLIGGAGSVAVIMSPSESVQGLGPLAVLTTGIGMWTAWLIATEEKPVARNGRAEHKRAA
jgi:hypothetical protein